MRKIVRIQIKNVMAIKDVEIVPGPVNQIVGCNGQGKTAFLKAFEWAFRGGGDKSFVRNGEDAAEVIVELADETTIRRRMNAKGGTSVEVKKGGMIAPAPQSYLNNLFETSSFNPIEILDPKKRNDAILQSISLTVTPEILSQELGVKVEELPPLDYTKHGLIVIEQARAYFYQRRTEANRDLADKTNKWKVNAAEVAEPIADLPSKEFVSDQISLNDRTIVSHRKSIETAQNIVAQHDRCKAKVTTYEAAFARLNDEIENGAKLYERSVADLRTQHAHALATLKSNQELEMQRLTTSQEAAMAVLKDRKERGQKAIDEARNEVPAEAKPSDGYVLELQSRIHDCERDNEQLRLTLKDLEVNEARSKHRATVDQLENDVKSAQAFADLLDARVESLSGPIKRKLMAAAEMPVEGLEYREGEFFVNGVSVDHLSTSESMVLAVSIARRLAKSTKAICIDGAEALDAETWKALRDRFGDDDDFTYFFTKVGDAFEDIRPEDKTFVMQHGEVM